MPRGRPEELILTPAKGGFIWFVIPWVFEFPAFAKTGYLVPATATVKLDGGTIT